MTEQRCHLDIHRKNTDGQHETLNISGPKSEVAEKGNLFVAATPGITNKEVISRVVAPMADSTPTEFFLTGIPYVIRMRCEEAAPPDTPVIPGDTPASSPEVRVARNRD